jgi:hypothetical protein
VPDRPIICQGSCHNSQSYFTFSYQAYSTHYEYAYYGDNVQINCYPEDADCLADSQKRIRETWMLVAVLAVFACCCLCLGCLSIPREELCGRAKSFLPGRFKILTESDNLRLRQRQQLDQKFVNPFVQIQQAPQYSHKGQS